MILILSLSLLLSVFTTIVGNFPYIKSFTDFETDLYNYLAQDNKGENIFFSPLSAHAVLSLAYQGAGGSTAHSFGDVLKLEDARSTANYYRGILYDLSSVENVTLNIANKVYVKSGYNLKSSFQNIARNFFLSEVEQVDFEKSQAAADTVNFWVQWKTNNKIKNIVSNDDFNRDTRFVLVNAIYFLGKWLHPFEKEYTRKEPFYLNNRRDKVDVDTMHVSGRFNVAYSEPLRAETLELPYGNSDLSLLITLPYELDGLSIMEQNIRVGHFNISDLTKDLKPQNLYVSLPKFKIETTLVLNDALKHLGLGVAFSDFAEFPGILDSEEKLKISKVIQKAFIEVSEEGTEAAAASAVKGMMVLSAPPSFIANHPFLFVLHSKRAGVLFSGRFLKP